MNKIILLILVFMGSMLYASPQIKGFIKNQNNKALSNANIYFENARFGTTSDENGYFSLQYPAKKDLLKISMLGYKEFSLKINPRKKYETLNIILEENDLMMDEITVTATLEKRYLKDITTKVEVRRLTDTDTQDFAATEVVSDISGITIEENGYSRGVAKINGLPADYSLVLLDGERINKGHGGVDLSQVPIGNVERIEVVKGPSSSLYGSDAIAGVINIITKDPKREPHFNLGYELGSHYTNIYNLGGNFKLYDLGVNLGGSIFNTEGRKLSEEYDNQNFYVKTVYGSKNKLKVSYNYFNEERNLFRMKEKKHRLKAEQEFTMGKYGNLKGSVYANFYDRSLYATGETKESNKKDYSAKMQYSLGWGKNNLFISGYEFWQKDIESYIITDDEIVNSFFAQSDFNLSHFTFTLGARGDYHKAWGFNLSPKLNIMYKYEDLSLRASYGRGFKAPTVDQLYAFWLHAPGGGLWIEGNPDLSPEKSKGYNFTVDYAFTENLKISGDCYYNDIADIIITDYIGLYTDGHPHYLYVNHGDLSTYGGSVTLAYSFLRYFNTRVNYDYTRTTEKFDLPNTPRDQMRFSLGMTDYPIWENILKLSFDFKCKYRGDAYRDYENIEKIDKSLITNLTTTMRIYDNFKLGFAIDNLFNANYMIYSQMPRRVYKGSISYEY